MEQIPRKKLAIILSAQGFHWEELAACYKILCNSAVELEFFTPHGKAPDAEPQSLKDHRLYKILEMSTPADLTPESALGRSLNERLKRVKPVIDLNPRDFSGLLVPGGRGCLFDINGNPSIHHRILEFYRSGKPMAALGHATGLFAMVKLQEVYIAEGKNITSYPEIYEPLLIQWKMLDAKFLPAPMSNQVQLSIAGAKVSWLQKFRAIIDPQYFTVDLPFISGVGRKSAPHVALILRQNLHPAKLSSLRGLEIQKRSNQIRQKIQKLFGNSLDSWIAPQ